eukprot:g14984.t1.2.5e174189 g14984  g14984.t1 contig21:290053-290654(-)
MSRCLFADHPPHTTYKFPMKVWRHFHEYITYVLHRQGINVAECILPLPMGATRGKQCTKNFLRFHQIKQQQSNITDESIEMDDYDGSETMIGRSAEDEGEYASRAEEIEAWLRNYGERYLGVRDDTITGDDAEGDHQDTSSIQLIGSMSSSTIVPVPPNEIRLSLIDLSSPIQN